MSVKKVKITIASVPYVISTDEDPIYTQKLAAKIEERIKELMSGSALTPEQALALTVLEFADISFRTQKENETLKSQIKEYLADAAQAKSERDMFKRELSKLKKNGASNG